MANTTHKSTGGTGGTGGTESFGNQGKGAGQNVGDAARKVADEGKSVASTAMHKAEEAASYVGHKAEDAASYLGHKAQDATGAVSQGMKTLGSTIRDKTPREGVMGQAGAAVASQLESGSRYLEEHGLQGIGEDMTNMIRRNPIPAVLIGIGIGFLIAQATRS